MKKFGFTLSEGNAAKTAAALTIVGVLVVGNATGVLGAFWRTLTPGIFDNNTDMSFGYGYGYGDGGWSYGYGYGYGNDYGYGYGSSLSASDPYYAAGYNIGYTPALTASVGQNVDISSYVIPANTSATLTGSTTVASAFSALGITPSVVQKVVLSNALSLSANISSLTPSVSIPAGTTIYASTGSFTTLPAPSAASSVSTVAGGIAVSTTNYTAIGTPMEFGIPNVSLVFDKLVTITLPGITSTPSAIVYSVNGTTWNTIGACGGSDPAFPGACYDYAGGTATIKTYHFTKFAAVTTYTASSGGSGGGGGGGGSGIAYDYCVNGDKSGSNYDGKCDATATGTTLGVTKTQSGVTVTITTASGTITTTFVKPKVILKSAKDIKVFDVQNNWAKNYIYRLVARGIVNNADKYNPDNGLTRAEFLKIVVNAAGIKVGTGTSTVFKDVPANTWYAPYVAYALSKNVISDKNANFRPNETISRAEAAKIIVRIFGVDVSTAKVTFSDVNPASDLTKYVETAKTLGIFAGQVVNGKSVFRPNDSITRAEIAKVVVNAFNL